MDLTVRIGKWPTEIRGRSLDENVKFNKYIKIKRRQLALHTKEQIQAGDPQNIYNLQNHKP